MADFTRAKVDGIDELKASLTALGPEIATKVGARANLSAAQVLKGDLVAAAPYRARRSTLKYYKPKGGGPSSRSDYGHLRDNIRIQKVTARSENRIVHLVTTGRAFWGRFVELGTRKMAARKWMQPTFDRDIEKLIETQVAVLRSGIEAAARRLARFARRRG